MYSMCVLFKISSPQITIHKQLKTIVLIRPRGSTKYTQTLFEQSVYYLTFYFSYFRKYFKDNNIIHVHHGI